MNERALAGVVNCEVLPAGPPSVVAKTKRC